MIDARLPYLLSYLLALIVVTAATILCFCGRLSSDTWKEGVLLAFAALGLIHMPSPGEIAARLSRSASISILAALSLLGGCEGSWRVPARDVAPRECQPPIEARGFATDYIAISPRLAPSSSGRGVVYTDSQTGRVRFLDVLGGSIEAGTAARIQTLSSNPSSPEEGRIYENTISHTLLFWDSTSWQTLATAGGFVPTSRQILTTAPLAGGGDFSINRTHSLTLAATPGLWVNGGGLAVLPKPSGGLSIDGSGVYIDATAVTPGSYPAAGQIPTLTIGQDGRATFAGSSSDGSGLTGVQAAGISLTGQTLWGSPAVGEVGYVCGDSTLCKARADAGSTVNAVCSYQGTAGKCQTDGPQPLLFESGLTLMAGETVYLSASIGGRVTNVAPSGMGQFVNPLGTLVSASGYDSMAGSAQLCVWRPSVMTGPLGLRATKRQRQ